MNLSDSVIIKEIQNGNIILEPFNVDYLNPNSVDLTLNPVYKTMDRHKHIMTYGSDPNVYGGVYFDCKNENFFMEKTMGPEGLILQPGELYIYHTNEKIGVKNNIRGTVMGKSSLGRLGLFVHVTAGFVDTGFEGSLVLEMVATIPIKVYPNQKICQIEFVRVEGDINQTYDQKPGSKYMNQVGSTTSLMHKNYENN